MSAKQNKYDTAIRGLLEGASQIAAEYSRDIRDIQSPQLDNVLEQKLVTFRLAMKIGNGRFLNEQDINPNLATSSFMKGECYFVRGSILLQKKSFGDASYNFEAAAKEYEACDKTANSLLCQFNSLIALINGGLVKAPKAIFLCNRILAQAEQKNIYIIQGLALRQKSYIYFQQKSYLASLAEIEKAISLFEVHGPASDYHLSLVHAADCCFDLKDLNRAHMFLDYIPTEHDNRVEFPLAYVRARISNSTLDTQLFADINPHWLHRYENHIHAMQIAPEKEQLRWSQRSSVVLDQKGKIRGRIKASSLEGVLLRQLIKGPVSKDLLCESLWPEFSSARSVDDRFFRLKARLEHKLGDIIDFDGCQYSLNCSIKIL
ncbi:MAG: hypothetical protein OM95_05450 [Bdellovibrio sp. ArHS]|uniref:hypothetical protein n=1 Tax=Bdellovibrio sp. ArHS TaxID=1569284 RepID=UPI00058341EE|nr:hypothetical protein [Bdellovibrio sp. ArHS]KHD88923.1 MAG: hypothetical protein OM95_05450 [Bdellovibrio sp. ArHS]